MRLLLEIIIVAAIIALAWEKSLKERASDIPWVGEKIDQSSNPRAILDPPLSILAQL